MKTRIFSFLAAMLLTGICAFAQSVEPIKGDVNGDGRVDVADINAIISIMAKGEAGYFYFGTVQPTAENYTSLSGVVGSYTSIAEASGATATVAAGETLYMLCPASWMEGKSVEMEDEEGNPISFLEEKDVVTISGYVIYSTQVLNDEKNVVLKTVTNYWYVGNNIQQSTSTITVATGTDPGWRKIDKSLANIAQYTSSNPLWNGATNPIQTGFTTVGCYLYLPKEYVDAGLGVYSGDGTAGLDNTFQKTSRQTITINSIVYYEYFKSGVYAQFDNIIYKK